MVIAIGPYKIRICKRRMAWQPVYLVQSDETFFGSCVTSASTQRCLIRTWYCGGVTEDFSLVLLLLHVCSSQAHSCCTVLLFLVFLAAWSLNGLHTLCILCIASIVAQGYVSSLDLGNLVQWPSSPIAKCLSAKASHLILSAFLISRTASMKMVSVLLFTCVPLFLFERTMCSLLKRKRTLLCLYFLTWNQREWEAKAMLSEKLCCSRSILI